MEKKKVDENIESPTDIQDKTIHYEINNNSKLTQTDKRLEKENMEVHHHSHSHGKRNWKSYIWEFIMLFLAVFSGFLAEYQLEHTIEHQREEQYIEALIEDAQTDILNIDRAIKENEVRILHLDSLANLSINNKEIQKNDTELYKHYLYGLIHPSFVTLTERTILQLKNAGGMRLIRNRNSANRIILYDGMTKKLSDQQAFYELYQNNSINLGVKLFNFQKFGIGEISRQMTKNQLKDNREIKLIQNDKSMLIEFGNTIIVYEGVVDYYNYILKETKSNAEELIKTLKKEYQIK